LCGFCGLRIEDTYKSTEKKNAKEET